MSEDSAIHEIFSDFSSSSSEEEISPDDKEEFLERTEQIVRIREEVFNSYPEIPDDVQEAAIILFYYSVQFILAYAKLGGEKPVHDPYNDTPEMTREKAHINYTYECFQKLTQLMEAIADAFYNTVYDALETHIGSDDHPLIFFLDAIERHKEMHSRHLKTDPGVGRSKMDECQATYNAVTNERYDFENINHKSWRSLIINPLPSDYDFNNIDPAEGGREHQLAIEIEKEKGTYNVPDPFSIVVTREWEDIFRTVHSLLHFEDYLFTRIYGSVSNEEWDAIEHMTFQEAWELVMTEEFYQVPIQKLSGGKKKIPPIVSAMIEMREMLKRAVVINK